VRRGGTWREEERMNKPISVLIVSREVPGGKRREEKHMAHGTRYTLHVLFNDLLP
jgi:hypothetical protein